MLDVIVALLIGNILQGKECSTLNTWICISYTTRLNTTCKHYYSTLKHFQKKSVEVSRNFPAKISTYVLVTLTLVVRIYIQHRNIFKSSQSRLAPMIGLRYLALNLVAYYLYC